jgi:hypothetical protein
MKHASSFLTNSFFCYSEGTLWDLRAFGLFKTPHKRLRPCRFFRCLGGRKLVHKYFPHLENSHLRLQECRFLKRTEGNLWVIRAISLLKTSQANSSKSLFECSECIKWVRMAFRKLQTSLHLLQQSRFISRPGGRLWVLTTIRLLKKSSLGLRTYLFLNAQNV